MKASLRLLNLLSRIPRWLPTVVVACVVMYLTLVPRPLGEQDIQLFEGADKVVHFLMFAGLAGALCLDVSRRRGGWASPTLPVVTFVAVIVAIAGGIIELLQEGMGYGRSAEWSDMVADMLGAFVGALVAMWVVRNAYSSSSHP